MLSSPPPPKKKVCVEGMTTFSPDRTTGAFYRYTGVPFQKPLIIMNLFWNCVVGNHYVVAEVLMILYVLGRPFCVKIFFVVLYMGPASILSSISTILSGVVTEIFVDTTLGNSSINVTS